MRGGQLKQDPELETLIPTIGGVFDVEPYTLAIRGRGDSFDLEYRQDGVANAVLTPTGGRGGIGVGAIAFDCKASGQNGFGVGEIASTLRSMGHTDSHQNGGGHLAVAFSENVRHEVRVSNTFGAPQCGGGKPGQGYPAVQIGMQVRRLTPLECERLQAFPDGYTAIPMSKRNRDAETSEMLAYFQRTGQDEAIRRGMHMAADGPRYKALGNSMATNVMRWIGSRIDAVSKLEAA